MAKILTEQNRIPEIAVIGHPNEGKSSVLSTLAEDDSVRISDIPGETVICRTFPVVIDGRELLRFTDTPGFQNPLRVLAELQKFTQDDGDCIAAFRRVFRDVSELAHDVELLGPVERGAGIIYVVDASRPIRNVDRAEMEILRLGARPRMAIMNCKEDETAYLDAWKNEFRRSFNANRVFNAHRATYAERISLLEALKSIDQDWQPLLDEIVSAFRLDWENRNSCTVDILLDLCAECLSYTASAPLKEGEEQTEARARLLENYRKELAKKERRAHDAIRKLFKHNLFNLTLPADSLLQEELFSERTWELLGLSRMQLAIVGGLGGAAIGAGVDLAAGGILLGLATAAAGLVGAAGALWGGQKLSETSILGLHLGGESLRVGPAGDMNLLIILLNRGLLFYRYMAGWAHGCRDYETLDVTGRDNTPNLTAAWSTGQLRAARAFFKAVTKDSDDDAKERQALREILLDALGDKE